MAHPAVLAFFNDVTRAIAHETPSAPRVLEVGSYDVNGSIRKTINAAIAPSQYVGADLTPGPGVDIVRSGHELDFPDGSFDLTLSAECLEHNPHWEATVRNMRRMTKPGGFVVITCATLGRLEHGTTRTNPESSPGTNSVGWDYYRNLSPGDFPKDFLESFSATRFWINPHSHDLYFIGSVMRALPQELVREVRFTKIKPTASFFTKLTFELPLNILRILLAERTYQEAGVALMKSRVRLRKMVAMWRK